MEKSDNFGDLICWQKAYQQKRRLKREVLSKLPRSEQYELRAQILRAARFSIANIAEGWVRYHYLDSDKFYYNSGGSLAEILDHITEAGEDEYISSELFEELKLQVVEGIEILNGSIFYLKSEHVESLKKP